MQNPFVETIQKPVGFTMGFLSIYVQKHY